MLPQGLFILMLLTTAHGTVQFAMENEEYGLTCDIEADWEVDFWLLSSDDTAYLRGETYEKYVISNDGITFTFLKVQLIHEGIHTCMTRHNSGTIKRIQVEMKVRPVPSDNLWQDRYKGQFMTGLIASLLFAVCATASCIVYKYRWVPTKEDKVFLTSDEGHTNPGLENEDEIVVKL